MSSVSSSASWDSVIRGRLLHSVRDTVVTLAVDTLRRSRSHVRVGGVRPEHRAGSGVVFHALLLQRVRISASA